MLARQEYDDVTDVLVKNRDRALAAAAERAAEMAPGLLIDTDQLAGAPAEAVTESGAGALMLVVGSRGRGAFTAMVLGSVSRYAASHASCPVVVVRDATTATGRQVGVGHRRPGPLRRLAHLRVRGGEPAPGQPAGHPRLAGAANRHLPGRG